LLKLNKMEQAKLLTLRLFEIINQFETSGTEIKITPSQQSEILSNKSIPFYYEINKAHVERWGKGNDYQTKISLLLSLDDIKALLKGMEGDLWKTAIQTAKIKLNKKRGEIISKTNYHHGNASLEGTASKMAQDFIGGRNFPFLNPHGM